ncbi:KPN_02809 family neutral zinc metallopeptidase [Marmoricola sp. RAF53]|uniref:KPN_02809 family neutral zinc metallopeptidase n=1 Tax=Marmoricola sp. RAF53 TaxID=3233059 RepID=UPI003F9B1B29
MRFNPKARVDQSQFDDRSGRSGGGFGGGGMRLPLPSGGGGKITLGTIVVALLVFFASQMLGGGLGGLTGSSGDGGGDQTSCQTGEQANASDKCAVALFTKSVQDYWTKTFPEQANGQYQPIKSVVFGGQTDSGCGPAASAMGPFYCPNDTTVYLDSTFFDQMLEGDLGAKGGPFSIGYVVAHEYGHHVENQLGILGRMRTQQGPRSDGVKVELMADCLAGMWAKDAQQTVDQDGNRIIEDLNADDISRAIDAAQAVGDDRIQQQSSGRVNPEVWTHGSSAQREHWFNVGLEEGSLRACNTFAPGAL